MMRSVLATLAALVLGGCSLFGYFEDPPCRDEAECAGQADGDADADADGDGDGDADVEPADFTGVYELDIRNGENECGFGNWNDGAVTENVQFTITQDGADASGTVGGAVGWYLQLTVGSDTLIGEVTGRDIELYLRAGSNSRDRELQCQYRAEGTLFGTLVGENGLEGRIEYGYHIVVEADDCGDVGTCVSTQTFSGSRPPR